MPDIAPQVIVVVLNWNNAEDTLQCLESLKQVEYQSFKVIVVDNGSNDDSPKEIKSFLYQTNAYTSEFIQNSENLGYGGGNNEGIRIALRKGAEYVLILNNDVSVSPRFINKLVEVAEARKKAGVLAPSIYYKREPEILWYGGQAHINWKKVDKEMINMSLEGKELPENAQVRRTEFVTGACMFVRRAVFEEVGLFRDDYFLYFEDADFSERVKSSGWNLVWVPHAKVWHKVSATSRASLGAPNMNYYNTRNSMLFVRRHGPAWAGWYIHLWAYLKYIKQITKLVFSRKYNPETSRAVLRAIKDYYGNNLGKYS